MSFSLKTIQDFKPYNKAIEQSTQNMENRNQKACNSFSNFIENDQLKIYIVSIYIQLWYKKEKGKV